MPCEPWPSALTHRGLDLICAMLLTSKACVNYS